MEKGVVFGRDMLGYTVKDGQLTLNPEEAKTVELIFHKYINEGKGTTVIARELFESGIRPVRTKDWSPTMILKILRNEKYVGDLLQKKTYTPDFLTHNKKYNNGIEDKVYLRNHHEPIIDRETWDRTQKELARRAPGDELKAKYTNRYWCSGKVKCGECTSIYINRTKKLKGEGARYRGWRCFESATKGAKKINKFGEPTGCDSPQVNDKVLLACMKTAVGFVKHNKAAVIKEIMEEITTVLSNAVPIDTSFLTVRLAELQKKKSRAINLHIEGILSRDEMKTQNREYDAEIELASRQLAEISNTNNVYKAQAGNLQRYIDEINKIMEFGAENEILYGELLDRMLIYRDKTVCVYLKCIPYGIRMRYRTSGRSDWYNVTIDNIEAADEPARNQAEKRLDNGLFY